MASNANASVNHRCSICRKEFSNLKALRSHLGNNSLDPAIAHPCALCTLRFCSAQALQQHQNSPSHNSKSNCNTCQRPFRSSQGLQDHQNATGHAESLLTAGAVSTPVSLPTSQYRLTRRSRSGGMGSGTAALEKLNSLTGQMMNMQLWMVSTLHGVIQLLKRPGMVP
jgi:hypothetical protein